MAVWSSASGGELESSEASAMRSCFLETPAGGNAGKGVSPRADWPTACRAAACPPRPGEGGGMLLPRSCVSAVGRLLGQSTAPVKRSANEATGEVDCKLSSAEEGRPLLDVADSDCLSARASMSSVAKSKMASVPKLATRNPRPGGICDPRNGSKFFGWIVSETETPGGTACNPRANPMANAATPAQIKRDPGRIRVPPSRPSVSAACSFAPRTPRPPITGRKKQSNYGKESSWGD